MTVRRFDGWEVECPNCCKIHFYYEDVVVSYSYPGEGGLPIISLEEWYNIPLKESLKYTSMDGRRWYSSKVTCWVRCPLCGEYLPVWDVRITQLILDKDSLSNYMDKSVQCLCSEEVLTESRYEDIDFNHVRPVYGREEEI